MDPHEVTSLALSDIETDEATFQWRTGSNIEDSSRHTQTLARILGDNHKPLDPILVVPRGAGFVVIDGHHRLEAYREAGWDRPIPVEIFQGTLAEAELEALRRNIKDKLPMTQEDKLEAAWRLVLGQRLSKAKINELTSVSNGTIGNMRHTLKRHGFETVEGLSWHQVKLMNFDLDDDFDRDASNRKKAERLAKEITDKASIHLAKNPEILAMALELISETLPKALVEQWFSIAEKLVDWEREHGLRI